MNGWVQVSDEVLDDLAKWGAEAADPHVLAALRTEEPMAVVIRIAVRRALWVLLGNGMIMPGIKPETILLDGPLHE